MSYNVSVIIPVYNAEKTLNNTISSVINQTFGFENIELILIDDNSNDNSKKIIEDYANKYSNVKPIFSNENSGGPGIPRNIGIDQSTAPFLIFLDSDDELTNDCCEVLYDSITRNNADIVSCSFYKKINGDYYAGNSINSKDEQLVDDIDHLRFTMWGNIFRSSLIKTNGIKCPNTLHEDAVFFIHAFCESHKVIKLPDYYGYVYNMESSSVTHNIDKKSMYDYLNGFKEINNFFNKYSLKKQRLINDIPQLFFMFFKLNESKEEKITILNEIRLFELSLDCKVKLNSYFINLLNNQVLNENYSIALFLSNIANKLYSNHRLKNFIFKKYSNLVKVEIHNIK